MKILNNQMKVNPFYLVLITTLSIFLILLIRTAWVSDDAYITFRTIDNFINGFGLRWNIAERVQSYTHPLWMLLLSGFYFITGEIFLTSIIVSIVLSLLTVGILLYNSVSFANSVLTALLLLSSKAFLDFSTSGLENSLTHLLLILFFILITRPGTIPKVLSVSFMYSLVLLNRLDLFLLVTPPYLFFLYKQTELKKIKYILAGLLPLVIWEVFSIIYYGYPFPNTALAKLNTGISTIDLIDQGSKYFYISFLSDPGTLLTIIFSLAVILARRDRMGLLFGFGIFSYSIYIIVVGGDFMLGRFLTAPFITGIAIINNIPFTREKIYTASVVIASVILLFIRIPEITGKQKIGNSFVYGVADERAFYYSSSNLIGEIRWGNMPLHLWVTKGKEAAKENKKTDISSNVGFYGFFAGPGIHIIDDMGLCDPLLSHLPCNAEWRPGHYRRTLPAGYENTIKTGIINFEDKDIEEYYRKIEIITRGEIWDFQRMIEIFKLNLGYYNYLIK